MDIQGALEGRVRHGGVQLPLLRRRRRFPENSRMVQGQHGSRALHRLPDGAVDADRRGVPAPALQGCCSSRRSKKKNRLHPLAQRGILKRLAAGRPRGDGLPLQRQIDRTLAVREASERDRRNARGGDFARPLKRNAARSFGLGNAATHLDALFHVRARHVVEHDPFGLRLQGGGALAQGLHFDFHRELRERLPRGLDRLIQRIRIAAAPQPPMVVLHEDAVVRMRSYMPMRWFVPPPQSTAYFSNTRRPGVVLRVSRMSVP